MKLEDLEARRDRAYARDCRWTQVHVTKNNDKFKEWDVRYKACDKKIRDIRKCT